MFFLPFWFAGRVWLCGHITKKCLQHPHRLQALYVHICSHCSAAFQREILLLYRQFQGHRRWVQVGAHYICNINSKYNSKINFKAAQTLFKAQKTLENVKAAMNRRMTFLRAQNLPCKWCGKCFFLMLYRVTTLTMTKTRKRRRTRGEEAWFSLW